MHSQADQRARRRCQVSCESVQRVAPDFQPVSKSKYRLTPLPAGIQIQNTAIICDGLGNIVVFRVQFPTPTSMSFVKVPFSCLLLCKSVNNTGCIQLLSTMIIFHRNNRQITETLLGHSTSRKFLISFGFENERSQVATVTGNISNSMYRAYKVQTSLNVKESAWQSISNR